MKPTALAKAARPVIETLEGRRLLTFTGSDFALPFVNDFSQERNGIEDGNGLNTGFPIVQGNTAGDEYQPALIDLDTANGYLNLTSRGTAANGGNFGADNTLANGLQLPFDAASGTFRIHTRISNVNAPLSQFDTPFEQAGLLFGPTQDNFAKLVLANDGSNTVVQFVVENKVGSTFNYPDSGENGYKSNVTTVRGVNLATANYIDLYLSGDPATGELTAQYRVEGGQTVRFQNAITIPEAQRAAFFKSEGARAGLLVQNKNDAGPITAAFDEFGVTREGLPSNQPAVDQVRPAAGATDVNRDGFIATDLILPNAGLDEGSLTSDTVKLTRVSDGKQVPAKINTSGGGDAIILQPLQLLDAQTEYRFEITGDVNDVFGVAFTPYSETFTTGFGIANAQQDVAFDQIALPQTKGTLYTSIEVGPDDKLYATTVNGQIIRWNINADDTLGASQTITSLTDAEGGPRVMTGLVFAPDATADNLVAYVTHTGFNDVTTDRPDQYGPDFSGKVTRLSGANLQTVRDVVTNLPRSIRDHLTNQPSFGPDGRLYFGQGADTAMGEPDAAWGYRTEHQLSAAVLAVDVDAIGDNTVNVKTRDAGGTYDPLAAGAPVTLYATGVRNSYNVTWHSNGHLYAPTNGSAAGGNTPQSPQPGDAEFGDDRTDLAANGPFTGQFVPGLNNVQQTQNDYLYDVEQGGYYGAPNPFRDEWVMNGGNPTSGVDTNEVPAYPVGTQPDRNYRGAAYDFGKNYSPDGALEYASDAFGGKLKGKLLVTRYSGGDDVVALTVDDNGEVVDAQSGIIGLSGFTDPLDLAQNSDGSMYVSEFGAQQITLVRPVEAGGKAKVANRRTFFNAAAGSTSDAHSFTIRNTGTKPLILSGNTLTFTGNDRALFTFANGVDMNAGEGDGTVPPTVAVQPGDSYSYQIVFTPPAGAAAGATYEAAVSVRTNDADAPEVTTRLLALTTAGEQGAAEPSLQRVLDLYGFGIDTGDDDPSNNDITPGGDLVDGNLFRRADDQEAVTVVPIASFGPDSNPAASVGYYRSGRPLDRTVLQEISGIQTVDPAYQGAVKFAPPVGVDEPFGLWMQTPSFNEGDGTGRVVYSEDQLNTFEPNAGERRKIFTYPLTLADGTRVKDSYIVTFEEFPDATDANDVVLIVRNVVPVATDGPKLDVQTPLTVPYSDRLVFSNIDASGRSSGEQVRNTQSVTIRNIGTSAVDLTGATASGQFSVSGFTPTTLDPNEAATFTVNFTATNANLSSSSELGRVFNGTLTVAADGTDDLSLPLAGYHQRYTEDGAPIGMTGSPNAEPSLDQIISLFGYDVDLGTAASRNNKGIVEAVGDEVLSEFWQAAGPDTPVEVYQLDAYHTVPTQDFFAWYPQGSSGTANRVTTNQGQWSQSVLPADTDGGALAFGTFTPGTQTFGLRVSNEYSQNSLNFRNSNDQGHHMRFFPLRDPAGNLVPDSWLVVVDFIGFNFDYNDNTYLVRGMRPAGQTDAPVGVSAFRDDNGEVVVDFGAVPDVEGYTVFRSVGGRDDFQKAHRGVITRDFFTDASPPDEDVYYRVYPITSGGTQGMFGEVHIA